MPDTQLIGTLLVLLDRSCMAERTLVAGLNDAERSATGRLERWSAKDLIAHLTSWQTYLAGLLSAVLSGETPELPGPTINEANAVSSPKMRPNPGKQCRLNPFRPAPV